MTNRVFDDMSENRVQKLDSLGEELRDGSTDTFIIFQMRPKALSRNRSANLRGQSCNLFFPVTCTYYSSQLETGFPTHQFGGGGQNDPLIVRPLTEKARRDKDKRVTHDKRKTMTSDFK